MPARACGRMLVLRSIALGCLAFQTDRGYSVPGLLAMCTGFGEWYDSIGMATVVGRVGKIRNQESCNVGKFGLDILCLESVRPVDGASLPRLRYSIGRLSISSSAKRPNQKMERTACGHYDLPFSSLSLYPLAVHSSLAAAHLGFVRSNEARN